MAQINNVTAEEVKKSLQDRGVAFLPNHDCGICGVNVGYIINGDDVMYRSGCGCGWSPDNPSSFQKIADWVNMQSHPDGAKNVKEIVFGKD